ncbi:hypothetical protein GCM10020001_088580 [Nonomuraea salmonea]
MFFSQNVLTTWSPRERTNAATGSCTGSALAFSAARACTGGVGRGRLPQGAQHDERLDALTGGPHPLGQLGVDLLVRLLVRGAGRGGLRLGRARGDERPVRRGRQQNRW